jgi:hypothetical protein
MMSSQSSSSLCEFNAPVRPAMIIASERGALGSMLRDTDSACQLRLLHIPVQPPFRCGMPCTESAAPADPC